MLKFHKIVSVLMVLSILSIGVAPVFAQGVAEIGLFDDVTIPLETRVEVPIEIRNVRDLYAVDVTISFNPAILMVEDAEPNKAGVQPGLGTFLDAGMTLYNEVDNQRGLVRFVMSQINPSEGKSGDGILLVLYFVGKQAGSTQITVEKAEFSDRYGVAVEVETVEARIEVNESAVLAAATPIPVQDQGGILVIETFTPTPTSVATLRPVLTATPKLSSEEKQGEDALPEVEGNAEEEVNMDNPANPEEGEMAEAKTGNYWWLLGLPLIIGAAFWAFHQRRKTKNKEDKGE